MNDHGVLRSYRCPGDSCAGRCANVTLGTGAATWAQQQRNVLAALNATVNACHANRNPFSSLCSRCLPGFTLTWGTSACINVTEGVDGWALWAVDAAVVTAYSAFVLWVRADDWRACYTVAFSFAAVGALTG